jgi:hypothetical protein
MKLGTQTNSLTNHLYSRMTIGQPEPHVGMGATILAWTDRYPGTIIKLSTTKTSQTVVDVQQDKATRIDSNGMSECQSYSYEANPEGRIWRFRQKKTGGWKEVTFNQRTGRFNKAEGGGYGLRIGERAKYHDYSF